MRLERWWAAAILFANGWLFALPVTDQPLPYWTRPIQVVHGVFLHEALFLAYLVFVLFAGAGRIVLPPRRSWPGLSLIVVLGLLLVFSGVVNGRPSRELAGAARYFVLAYFGVAAVWVRRYSPAFVLRNLLLGLASAGAFTLYYSFVYRVGSLGGLPLLLGQNGPGGHLAVGVMLSAWLVLERQMSRDATIAVFALVVGVIGASISYSKLAMLIAAAGLIAWLCVSWRVLTMRRTRRWYVLIVLAATIAGVIQRETVVQYVKGVNTFITYKFRNLDSGSISSRSQYFLITAEIMARYPFGVGYGGFYEAALATSAHRSSRAAIEDPDAGARGEANPHSSFLYYGSANGVLGLFVALSLFAVMLLDIRRALLRKGAVGYCVWVCLAGGYLVFALTLPTLFNTAVLYLPAAAGVVASASRRSSSGPERYAQDALLPSGSSA